MVIARDRKKNPMVLFITIRWVLLMRIIKSVSLPLHLAQKVEQIPNFSAYVASAIQSDTDDKQIRHIVALKRALARSHETMRRIQELPQQMTRKAGLFGYRPRSQRAHSPQRTLDPLQTEFFRCCAGFPPPPPPFLVYIEINLASRRQHCYTYPILEYMYRAMLYHTR